MSSNNQVMALGGTSPTQLDAVFAFLDPQTHPERKERLFTLCRQWVAQELKLYGTSYHTDEVECTVELQKVKATFAMDGVDQNLLAYQLKLTILGQEPQHPQVEVDALFVINDHGIVDNLVLSRAQNLTEDEQPPLC